MKIRKRDGRLEDVNYDKINIAVARHAHDLQVDPHRVVKAVIQSLHDGSTTAELDRLATTTAADLIPVHPDYGVFASRLLWNLIDKEVNGHEIYTFSQSTQYARKHRLLSSRYYRFVSRKQRVLNKICESCVNNFKYFGLKVLYDRYLLRSPVTGRVVETPAMMLLRVASALSQNYEEIRPYYEALYNFKFMHSSPTLFNAGLKREQMSSCYILDSPEDSLEGIYDNYKDIARLSKYAGGIGLSYSRVRSRGSHIEGTNGKSNGIISFLKTLDSSIAAVNQGGRRKGAACVYLETWHADIEAFLELRDNTGDEAQRTHNLNLANWIPDIFMRRVQADATWSLFDPAVAPELVDLHNEAFDVRYEELEAEGKYVKQLPARKLYERMMRTLAQTGNGWMCFKDTSNRHANQKGTVHSSNLCVAGDQTLLTDKGHIPIAELHGQEVNVWNGFEWSTCTVMKTGVNAELVKVTLEDGRMLTCTPYHKFLSYGERIDAKDMLGRTTDGASLTSFQKSPRATIVISVEPAGSGDTYCVNEPLRHTAIFNGIYTGNCTEIVEVNDNAHTAVCNLGSVNLGAHFSDGLFDNEGLKRTVDIAVRHLDRVIDINFYPTKQARKSNEYWRPIGLGLMGLQDALFKLRIPFEDERATAFTAHIQALIQEQAYKTSAELAAELGPCPGFAETKTAKTHPPLRNSLLIAIAPTATIASICGCYECTEPQLSNIFKRETLSGEFIQLNEYLFHDLAAMGLELPLDALIASRGSIQHLDLPSELKALYKTVWEVSQKAVIRNAAVRQKYIDQSQSTNLFIESPTIGKLSSMYMHAWKSGLKTTYYLRSRPANEIATTTVSTNKTEAQLLCSLESPESCESCQ